MRRLAMCFGLAALTSVLSTVASADEREMPEVLTEEPAFAGDYTQAETQVETLPELEPAPDDDDSGPLPLRFEASLQGMLAVPFAGDRGSSAFGFAITYGVGYGEIPLLLGLDFMSASSSAAGSFQMPAAEGDALPMRKHAQSKTLYFDLWLRVQPPRWALRPYLEGFIGAKLVEVRYSLNRADAASDDAVSGSADDWSRSLGYGAGIDFAGLLKLAGAVSITLGVRRVHAPRATFTLRGDVGGQRVTTRQDVASSALLFSLGIMGWLDRSVPAQP
jgi:hypothetical protein